MKKKFKKKPMLTIPYLEFWSELTNEEASMISGGEIKITQQQINNDVIIGENVQICSRQSIIVNGEIVKENIKGHCQNKPNISSLSELELPDISNLQAEIKKLVQDRLAAAGIDSIFTDHKWQV